MSLHSVVRAAFYWLPAIAWGGLIFTLSGETFHSGFAQEVVRAVLLFVWPAIPASAIFLVHIVLRKLAHIVVYGVFTFFLYRALSQNVINDRYRRWVIFSILIALGVAGLDELRQSLLPERTGSLQDFALDGVGIVLAHSALWWRRRQVA